MAGYGPGFPIYVLEGPDGSGKTTLADALVKGGFEYDHRGPPDQPAMQFSLEAINRHHDKPTVIDRLHPGSYVYGKAFRGMDDLTDFERWIIDGTVMSRQGMMIYCCPPFEQTQKNLERGPDNADAAVYEDPAKRERVRELYEEYMQDSGVLNQLDTIRYDYTRPGVFERTTQDLLGYAATRKPSPAHSFPALGNTVNPKAVIVTMGPRAFSDRWEPPLTAAGDVTRTGRYIHLALTAGQVPLRDVCIISASHVGGLDTNSDFWRFWEQAKFIALGRDASEQLAASRIVHQRVVSPADWAASRYKDVRVYSVALRGGLAELKPEDYAAIVRQPL